MLINAPIDEVLLHAQSVNSYFIVWTLPRKCLGIICVLLRDLFGGPWEFISGSFKRKYNRKHVKDLFYKFEHQITLRTYQGTIEHASMSKD